LTRLAPKVWFLWTGPFLVLSAGGILAAAGLAWANRQELVSSFAHALRWETAALAWLTLLVVTTCHEFAHGLTCKHYGGEVHEMGFLLLFFMPCFYCNVSDAWLFRAKSQRLWVTLAGGYCDLCLWAAAVALWRLTLQDTLMNYLAWVVLSVLGVRIFFNFNPFLKLDGYYLLSDWVAEPNLQQRSLEHLKAHLRWLLWGARRPGRLVRGGFLLGYGILCLFVSVGYLVLMGMALAHFLGEQWGLVGIAVVLGFGVVVMRGLFQGFLGGEVRLMLLRRYRRTVLWCLAAGAVVATLFLVRVEDRASGSFQVRPVVRAEVRAPVAGFVRAVYAEEGSPVAAGAPVIRLEVPHLTSRAAQKRAEVRESEARLRLLEVGPRPEEVAAQRRRVERAVAWRDLARRDLGRAEQAFEEEMARLDRQIAQHLAEADYATGTYQRAGRLLDRGALAEEQYQEAAKRSRVGQAQLEQAQAQKRARRAIGTRDAEVELARREKELADAQATLTLLEAGTRPEELAAEQARLARVREELQYLEDLERKTSVYSPVAGLVTTPRLAEKVGQYAREGEVLCVVEEPSVMEAEITLTDQEVRRVRPGQAVELKARVLPFRTFPARVDRLAPRAVRGEVQSTVTVYCRLHDTAADLRPGMIGHARIYHERRRIGVILLDRGLRFLRTEFWW
jgi:multidrug efflux pump subunit AcrA (membrane-fusion protein)